ncbi:MAG TPA: hemerythrin domain-containing protein [Deltaproteobacteria bacterium]|nr:hemerythrin domain-containing protein [Deltaproteobacteria bacterium]
MHTGTLTSRRRFLCFTGSLAAGIALPAIPPAVLAAGNKEGKEKQFEVNPVEDLMREHGVLRRVLLIYEEAISRIRGAKEVPSAVIADATGIIRRFVEDYHEKLEEAEIFPRFEKAGKLNDLVKVLFVQHQAGRRLTDSILKLSKPEAPKAAEAKEETDATMQQMYGGTPLLWKGKGKGPGFSKQDLSSAMQTFIEMYRPHAAREDTVLFPAFRSIVSPMEFDELGEKFEDKEKELFGKEGFEKMVESVGEIEKKLGIYELSKFTPKI